MVIVWPVDRVTVKALFAVEVTLAVYVTVPPSLTVGVAARLTVARVVLSLTVVVTESAPLAMARDSNVPPLIDDTEITMVSEPSTSTSVATGMLNDALLAPTGTTTVDTAV